MGTYSPYKLATTLLASTMVVTGLISYMNNAPEFFIAISVGNTLAFLHIISGFYILDKYFRAENKLFFRAVFGGMAIRMVVTLLLMALFLGLTEIQKFSFTVSLVISYILYSVVEMIYIYKNLEEITDNS